MVELRFTVKVSIKDVKEFQSYHMKKSIAYKIFKIVMYILMTLLLLLFIVSPKEFWYFGILGLLYAFILFVHFPYMINKRANDNYKTQKGYESDINYVINNEEIIVKGNSFESKHTWDFIFQTMELNNIFVLYANKLTASIIPKRCIVEDTLVAFRELIKDKQLSKKK